MNKEYSGEVKTTVMKLVNGNLEPFLKSFLFSSR